MAGEIALPRPEGEELGALLVRERPTKTQRARILCGRLPMCSSLRGDSRRLGREAKHRVDVARGLCVV